ncbi:MAG: hypothetical protein JWM20_596 [Patescibacteria group bacterium]|nr:hypothetical protein [Patescibacteria group bacterium]
MENNQIILKLKSKIEDISAYGSVDAETQRNVLKEELQFYVLDFIYHHPDYSKWTMYGGSALRICHNLNRMSVDLDFEIDDVCTEEFLKDLKKEVETHFSNNYNAGTDFLTVKTVGTRGLRMNFNIGTELGLNHSSEQVRVKVDLNCFTAPKTVTERIPINRDQFSFVIKTYNMSALMSSKIAAIFLRGQRIVGKDVYEEKGRDIYDLLWYMEKQVVPDLDYLIAKNIDVADLRGLFNKLTIQMNKVSDANLEQDLRPLFLDQGFISNWLKAWRETYLWLLKSYTIHTVTSLQEVIVHRDFRTDNFSFVFYYQTTDKRTVNIVYTVSDYWITFKDGDLSMSIDENVGKILQFSANGSSSRETPTEKLKQYATLFYNKTESYFKKTHREMLRNTIKTKTIRMTADNLNQKEQIVLDRPALISCDLDDLLM